MSVSPIRSILLAEIKTAVAAECRPLEYFLPVSQGRSSTCWASAVASCLRSFHLSVELGDLLGEEVAFAKKIACGGNPQCPVESWDIARDVEAVLKATQGLKSTPHKEDTLSREQLLEAFRCGAIFIVRKTNPKEHVVCAFRAVPGGRDGFRLHTYDSLGDFSGESYSPTFVTGALSFQVEKRR